MKLLKWFSKGPIVITSWVAMYFHIWVNHIPNVTDPAPPVDDGHTLGPTVGGAPDPPFYTLPVHPTVFDDLPAICSSNLPLLLRHTYSLTWIPPFTSKCLLSYDYYMETSSSAAQLAHYPLQLVNVPVFGIWLTIWPAATSAPSTEAVYTPIYPWAGGAPCGRPGQNASDGTGTGFIQVQFPVDTSASARDYALI